MTIYRLGALAPDIDPSAWVAREATVIAAVSLGRNASVWPGATLRADNEPILIGEGSNIQEGAVLHTDPGWPLTVGAQVTVGHQAMLHGCTVGNGSLIGVQAVMLNGAVIGRHCLVAAGAVITEGKTFPDRSLIVGAPAKVVRELDDEAIAALTRSAEDYVARAKRYAQDLSALG